MKLFKSLLFVLGIFVMAYSFSACGNKSKTEQKPNTTKTEQPAKMKIKTKQGKEYTSAYVCPMHCDGSGADKPGTCPVCGMDYVANKDAKKSNTQDDHEGHNH